MLSVSSGMYLERNDSKKAGFPCSGLNLGSFFMSQDEGMSESPVETLESAVGLHLMWTVESYLFDTSICTWNSMLQKVTMPYSS